MRAGTTAASSRVEAVRVSTRPTVSSRPMLDLGNAFADEEEIVGRIR